MKTAPDIKISEKPLVEGRYVIRQWQSGQIKYDTVLVKTRDGRTLKKYIVDKESMKGLTPLSETSYTNKIVSDNSGYGVNLLLRQMGGDAGYPIEIDEAAFGTGTTPPAATDTDLETETVSDVTIQDTEVVNNVLTLSIFIPSGDMPDDTYTEIGLKMTNRLFSRSSMNYVKTANKDTTVEYVITFNV